MVQCNKVQGYPEKNLYSLLIREEDHAMRMKSGLKLILGISKIYSHIQKYLEIIQWKNYNQFKQDLNQKIWDVFKFKSIKMDWLMIQVNKTHSINTLLKDQIQVLNVISERMCKQQDKVFQRR